MHFRIILPTEALRPYISRYVFVMAEGSTDIMTPPADDPRFVNGKHVQQLLPNYGSMIFMQNVVADINGTSCDGLVLLGANQTTIPLTTVSGWFEGMMLDFEPGGMHALLGIDLEQLSGKVLSATDYADERLLQLDRLYKDAPTNFMGQLLISFFRIGTVGMALCLCWETTGSFPYRLFWMMSGMVFLVFVVKMLCTALLDYTFSLSRRFGTPYEHYGNLWTLMTLVLYPAVLILLRCASPVATRWTLGIAVGVLVLLWLYRIIHTYMIAPKAILYVLIYICTLELLPFAGVAYLSAKMISML